MVENSVCSTPSIDSLEQFPFSKIWQPSSLSSETNWGKKTFMESFFDDMPKFVTRRELLRYKYWFVIQTKINVFTCCSMSHENSKQMLLASLFTLTSFIYPKTQFPNQSLLWLLKAFLLVWSFKPPVKINRRLFLRQCSLGLTVSNIFLSVCRYWSLSCLSAI